MSATPNEAPEATTRPYFFAVLKLTSPDDITATKMTHVAHPRPITALEGFTADVHPSDAGEDDRYVLVSFSPECQALLEEGRPVTALTWQRLIPAGNVWVTAESEGPHIVTISVTAALG